MDTLTARMPNPAVIIPEAMKPIQDPVPDEIWDAAARHYDERGSRRSSS